MDKTEFLHKIREAHALLPDSSIAHKHLPTMLAVEYDCVRDDLLKLAIKIRAEMV